MSAGPDRFWDDEIVFRTLAAPGLDEDDLFAAFVEGPGHGARWGTGAPQTYAVEPDDPGDPAAARLARHRAALTRWPPITEGGA